MSHPPTEQLTMVVGFDFSPLAELALREAATLVATTSRGELHLVWAVYRDHDWSPPEGGIPDLAPEIDRMRATAERALRAHGDGFQVEVFHHLLDGDPARAILDVAEDVQADLILVGTHGRTGVRRLLLGSVAEKVVREARCPVLVMRPRRAAPAKEADPEPPCPACTAARERTAGAERWCQVHAGPYRPPTATPTAAARWSPSTRIARHEDAMLRPARRGPRERAVDPGAHGRPLPGR